MNSLKSTKILVTSLICIITIVLCSCNRTSFDSHNYSTTLELVGYESGNSLAIKYPSGEQAALVPLEMATAGFPGIADTRQDNGDVQFHVFYGYNQKRLHWAVICSGPSLGFMNTNVLLSEDGGKNWSLVSDIRNLDNAKNALQSPKVPWFPPAYSSRSINWERQDTERPHLVRGYGIASGHHPRCEDKAWIGGGAHLYSRKFALSDGEHGRNLL